MANIGYNTNLAAEFHVLSMMHRLGVEANLTLGNKKSVDIASVRGAGDAITIDVKGLAGATGWPVDNLASPRPGHFIVFVCYLGKIGDLKVAPEVWIIPSAEVPPLVYHSPNGKRRVVQRATLKTKAAKYKDAWHLLV
jgi:hypothetical protein